LLWQVLRDTMLLVLIGIIIGVPLALGGTHLVRSMIFGLGFADPVAILVAAVLLAMVAALAGFLTAWRASRVDPIGCPAARMSLLQAGRKRAGARYLPANSRFSRTLMDANNIAATTHKLATVPIPGKTP
jgi:hypothetical protein